MSDLTIQFISDMDINFPNYEVWRMNEYNLGEGDKTKVVHCPENEAVIFNGPGLGKNERQGIFFSPNGELRGTGPTKKKDNALGKRVFSFVCDIDKTFEDKPWEDFPLKPSAVVKTFSGFHIYWFVEPFMYGEIFDTIEGMICGDLGGDIAAKDLVRMYRYPGFTYWKTKNWSENDGSYCPEVVLYEKNIRYKLSDFTAILGNIEGIESDEIELRRLTAKTIGSKTYDEINSIPVEDVLMLLDSNFSCKGTRFYEGGKITSGYRKHPTQNYINDLSKKGRAQGGPFAIAKHYLQENLKVFKFFQEKFFIQFRSDVWSISEGVMNDSGEIRKGIEESTLKETIIINGSKQLIIDREKGKTWRVEEDGKIQEIMAGSVFPKGYFEDTETLKIHFIIEYNTGGRTNTTIFKSLGQPRDYDVQLANIGLTMMGTKIEKMHLINHIHEKGKLKKYYYITEAAIHDGRTMFLNGGKYESYDEVKGINYYVDIKSVSGGKSEDQSYINISDNSSKDVFMQNIKRLGTTYHNPIIYSLFTLMAMGLFTHYIRQTMPGLPIGVLVGLTQSGKTTARRMVAQMLGINEKNSTIQASSTRFTIDVVSKNYLPIMVTEYDNENIKFDWDTQIKNLYDGTATARGTAGQSIIEYPQKCLMIIDGETRSMTSSVYTRTINLHMNPIYRKSVVTDFDNISGYFMENFDNIKDLEKNLEKRQKSLFEDFKEVQKNEKDRIIYNYALLLGFADCFGFIDVVGESILEQCSSQFEMMGTDSLEKDIRNIINISNVGQNRFNMPIRFEQTEDGKDFIMNILFITDSLKINQSTYYDLLSKIKTINHHFHTNNDQGDDVMRIPMSYLFKTTALHHTFNQVLNTRIKFDVRFTDEVLNVHTLYMGIMGYAEANKYTNQTFYHYLVDEKSYIIESIEARNAKKMEQIYKQQGRSGSN